MSSTAYSKQDCLAHVEKSPKAVAIHDKAAWLAIFSESYHVEDPVGSSPHKGEGDQQPMQSLGKFYDTFIAPNHIHFDVAHDLVNELTVVRDLNVHTRMSDKLEIIVPMHLLYELEAGEGGLKIKRLAAHWELMPMMVQLFSKGFACIPILAALSVRMIRLQGVSGVLGFSKAAFSIGKKGKRKVETIFEALNQKHVAEIQGLLEHVENFNFGEKNISLDEIETWRFDHFETGKMIAAGQFVSCSFVVHMGKETYSGVAMFEFDKEKRVIGLNFYC